MQLLTELSPMLAAEAGVIHQLGVVIVALASLVLALIQAVLPWTPLIAWIAFWLLAVNWRQLYPVLMQGAWIGVFLMALMAILVWASVAEPAGGAHRLYGLTVDNVIGKAVYVTALAVIAMLCGSVQLAGGCGRLCRFEEPEPVPAEDHHNAH